MSRSLLAQQKLNAITEEKVCTEADDSLTKEPQREECLTPQLSFKRNLDD